LKKTRTHCRNWIKSLIALGLQYEILILEEFANTDSLPEAEREWIAEARQQGVPLTNHTDGGEWQVKRIVGAESRAKMSLAHKGKPRPWRRGIPVNKRRDSFKRTLC
jgi:hypothetical protein